MGGTVNAISRRHSVHSHATRACAALSPLRAQAANAPGGGNADFEYGESSWMVGVRAAACAPGTSKTNAGAGLGYYGDKLFVSFGVQ